METKAFVFVETKAGKAKEVALVVREMTDGMIKIKSVDVVTGPYDAIISIEGENPTKVATFVCDAIHPLEGIVRTMTTFVV